MTQGTYKIEKNVALPRAGSGKGGGKYPFDIMQIGDRFLYPIGSRKPAVAQSHIAVVARQFGKRHDMKFTTRFLKAEGAIGVWRVA